VAHWNTNGFTRTNEDNYTIRTNILNAQNHDIISINETFLRKLDLLEVNNYTWFGNNRKNINPRALRGSGGVGFLIKNSILINYIIKVVDDSVEDILWLEIKCKNDPTNYLHVCSCYLPPENSTRGCKAEEFFDNLLGNIHKIIDSNPIIICGDFNARVGNTMERNDALINRTTIDNTSNSHGKKLLTFLEDSDCCILNGRVTPEKDEFTCTRLGKSVVDYIITPVDTLNAIKEMKVELVTDIIDQHKIPITVESTKIPDHSYLTCTIEI